MKLINFFVAVLIDIILQSTLFFIIMIIIKYYGGEFNTADGGYLIGIIVIYRIISYLFGIIQQKSINKLLK